MKKASGHRSIDFDAAVPLSHDAIAALKREAENAPDVPGSADWGRKAVLRLIASHEELRESIRWSRSMPLYSGRPWGFCPVCGVLMDHEHLQRQVDEGKLTSIQAYDCEARHHRPGCVHALSFARWASLGSPDSWYPGQIHHCCAQAKTVELQEMDSHLRLAMDHLREAHRLHEEHVS